MKTATSTPDPDPFRIMFSQIVDATRLGLRVTIIPEHGGGRIVVHRHIDDLVIANEVALKIDDAWKQCLPRIESYRIRESK